MNREWWEKFWRSVILYEKNFFGKNLFRFFFSLIAFCYDGITYFRNRAYDVGFFRIFRSKAKVISIGNISLGGTGKTELTLWCAERFLQKNNKVAILSRGYGRSSQEEEVVCFSNGRKPDPRRMGDEPVFLSERLKGVPVFVGADRVKNAALACKNFAAEVVLLDDGFQHRKLHRDLDIVCLDDSILHAPAVFPRGVLREGMDSILRADFVVVKTEAEPEEFMRSFRNTFQFPLPTHSAFFRYQFSHIRDFSTGKEFPPSWLQGKEVLTFSAIAHPENFEKMVVQCGGKIQSAKRFTDHHFYEEKELVYLHQESKTKGWFLVTTEKDAVKLSESFPAFVASVRIHWLCGEKELAELICES